MSSRKEVHAFLNQLRKTRSIYIVNRSKNRETFWALQMTLQDQIDLIKSLSSSNYWRGPLNDDDPSRDGKIWIFKKNYQNHRLYIKVKVDETRNTLIVISCHIDEY